MRLVNIESPTYRDTIAEVAHNDLPETELQPGGVSDSSKEAVAAQQALNKLDDEYRAGNNPNMPLDFEKRLELALKDSKRATEIATATARTVNNLSNYVQREITSIGDKLDKIAGGEQLEADEPGASIFDD